jgi:two-component system, cell cycle sensor histidine kinase and response regulator CckA
MVRNEVPADIIQNANVILLVDDEEPIRRMTSRMLARMGFSILEAVDGIEAVEVFEKYNPKIRLAVLDLAMPRMNGWETLNALRKLRSDLPVILASGYDKAVVMQGDHPELPQVFLHKPYRKEELKDAIDAL